jgi:hypothetical protein
MDVPLPPTEGDIDMRYMLIMRATPEAEKFAEENVDFNEIIAAMGRFNEEMIKARAEQSALREVSRAGPRRAESDRAGHQIWNTF